jgi:hypothetical protein
VLVHTSTYDSASAAPSVRGVVRSFLGDCVTAFDDDKAFAGFEFGLADEKFADGHFVLDDVVGVLPVLKYLIAASLLTKCSGGFFPAAVSAMGHLSLPMIRGIASVQHVFVSQLPPPFDYFILFVVGRIAPHSRFVSFIG